MLKRHFKRAALVLMGALFIVMGCPLGLARGEELGISAQSAVVITGDTGAVLYEKDAHTPRPMASTTKIMTALLTLEEAARQGDPVVEITQEMVAVEGSSMGLQPGDRISLKNLAAGMLVASGNDGANAAALFLDGSLEQFVQRMNRRAEELGMEDTHFVTPSGLDGVSQDGKEHASTAWDMALLAREAMKNSTFREIVSSETYTVKFADGVKRMTYTNHNKLLTQYPGCVGVKTGFTKAAGRCLVSAAQREGSLLIAVTLNAPDDWNDHQTLLDAGFSQIERVTLKGEDVSLTIPVAGGDKDKAAVLGWPGPTVTLPLGRKDQVVRKVCIPAFVYGPLRVGDPVGELRWYLDGQLLGTAPLTVAEDIPAVEKEPGFWTKLFGGGS